MLGLSVAGAPLAEPPFQSFGGSDDASLCNRRAGL
jgi:hypothetical protein